jgi:hypothetical protein
MYMAQVFANLCEIPIANAGVSDFTQKIESLDDFIQIGET